MFPLEEHRQQDDKEQERDGVQHIHDAHHDMIDPTTEIARRCTPRHAHDQTDQRRDRTDQERQPATLHRPHEQVPTEVIGAEPVTVNERGRQQSGVRVHLTVVVW